MKEFYIGIDVGSVSTNLIAMDNNYNVLSKQYIRTNGQPLESVRKGLNCLREEFGKEAKVLGAGTTGSGRQLTGIMIGADVVKNEITAHATATTAYLPEARTIFEIGGQDSKIIMLKNSMVVDFCNEHSMRSWYRFIS